MEGVPAAIVAANSLAVDAVAGATLTSNGILEAVEAALTAAGVDPSAYKAAPETDEAEAEKTAVEQTTDVLVIGAGIAGLSSAMSAKENGADVVIIDKMSAPGGTTNLAGGILVCVDSELFADNRLESDSMEAHQGLREERMAYGLARTAATRTRSVWTACWPIPARPLTGWFPTGLSLTPLPTPLPPAIPWRWPMAAAPA